MFRLSAQQTGVKREPVQQKQTLQEDFDHPASWGN